MEKTYYAIEVKLSDGTKLLCWEHEKHFYFAKTKIGFLKPLAPTLFNTKREAITALKNIPSSGGNLKQFNKFCDAKQTNIVKVLLSLIK